MQVPHYGYTDLLLSPKNVVAFYVGTWNEHITKLVADRKNKALF